MRATSSLLMMIMLVSAPVWAGAAAPQVVRLEDMEKLISNVRGTFDMTKQPRPYIGLLILDQEGNRYPSFWCGMNAGGLITFEGRHDLFDDKVVVEQRGSMTVHMTTAARKVGMYDRLPGGVWVASLREEPLGFILERFSNATLKGTRPDGGERGAGGKLIQIEADVSGQVTVGKRRAPFRGRALLEFSDNTPLFRLVAKFPFPGKELGLEGAKGEGISATLYTTGLGNASGLPTLDEKVTAPGSNPEP